MTTCQRGHEMLHDWNRYASGACRSCSRARAYGRRTGYDSETDISEIADEIYNELEEDDGLR